MAEALEQLLKDLTERMTALGGLTSEENIRKMVSEQFNLLTADEKFVRKMRFGGDGSEKKLVGTKYARWGLSVADIEWLYDMQSAARGARKINGGVHEGPSEMLQNTFGAISDAMYMSSDQIREIDRKAIDDLFPRIPLSWFHGNDQRMAKKGAFELTEVYQRAIRAMDSAETGYGLQLIGAQYVGDMWDAARRDSLIFALIDSFEMTDPVAYLPVEVDFPEMLFVPENTSATASAYGTTKTGSNRVAVTAYKFIIHQVFSGEIEEDSIVPFVPFLRRQAQLGMNFYLDSLVLNGDTTNAAIGNINLDDADPADTKHYLALDGIRHIGLVDNTGNSKDMAGSLTYAALVAARGRMMDATNKVDWGHPIDPNDLVRVGDPETVDKISLLDEVITVDKMGPQATVLTGQQAKIGRDPLIGSMAVSKTEADGKVSTTAGNNTKGQLISFNRRAFKTGWRRRVRLEVERVPGTDQTRMFYSLRLGMGRFSPTGAASGIEGADVIYNITL